MIASLFTVGIVFVLLYLALGLILVSCVTFSGASKVKARQDILTCPILSDLFTLSKRLLRVSVSVLFGACGFGGCCQWLS